MHQGRKLAYIKAILVKAIEEYAHSNIKTDLFGRASRTIYKTFFDSSAVENSLPEDLSVCPLFIGFQADALKDAPASDIKFVVQIFNMIARVFSEAENFPEYYIDNLSRILGAIQGPRTKDVISKPLAKSTQTLYEVLTAAQTHIAAVVAMPQEGPGFLNEIKLEIDCLAASGLPDMHIKSVIKAYETYLSNVLSLNPARQDEINKMLKVLSGTGPEQLAMMHINLTALSNSALPIMLPEVEAPAPVGRECPLSETTPVSNALVAHGAGVSAASLSVVRALDLTRVGGTPTSFAVSPDTERTSAL